MGVNYNVLDKNESTPNCKKKKKKKRKKGGGGKGLTGQRHYETFQGWGNALHDFSNGALLTKNREWTLPTRCQHYAAQLGQPKITPETVKSPLGGKTAAK